jgi:hypothetical protein
MAVVWRYPLQPLPAAAGTAVTAAALTSGLGGLPVPQLPPIMVPGTRLILVAHGEVTSTSATPTCTLGFYIGSVGQAIGSKTVLAVSPALALLATTTGWQFIMKWSGTFRTLSPSAGVIHGQGKVDWWGNVSLTGAGGVFPMPVTQAARTVSTLNTDQVNEVDVGVTLSSTTGTPSVSITDFFADLSG